MTTVVLVRHGQASWGKRDYDKLSPLGVRQAGVVGTELRARGVTPTVFRSGQMFRQRDTATEMSTAAGWVDRAVVDPRWNEYDHMSVITSHKPAYRSMLVMRVDLARTMQPIRAFNTMYAAAITRWVDGAGDYPETFEAFGARVDAALDTAVELAGPSGTVVAATSAGAIARVVTRAVEGSAETWVRLERTMANGSLTTLNVGSRGIHLVTFNEHRHLHDHPGLVTTR